jgi:hypothetical protein
VEEGSPAVRGGSRMDGKEARADTAKMEGCRDGEGAGRR